ncbi:MAG: stage 0 sporulation family protein [Clostridia bacterium]|nr:stage 0 sporulation family protein [Clostridia bacterium]
MAKLIGVQFQKNGKLYYFDANGFEVKPGDYVIVDTARGHDLGEVTMGPREADEETWRSPLKKTIRIATEQDIQHGVENRQKEKEAFSVCQKKIAEHKLEMKLVSVEYAFDNSKILFFFTANGRVDFRALVKDLASIFKMRIELRQIGVRDEAKMLGGLGPCGRPICCGTFLDQFQPVSIKMAKEQNLSLNPTKISGVCGRLMCCLKYEQEHYEMTRKKMPKIGREVITPDGAGPVTDLNIVKETVFVRLTNGDTSEIKEYPLEAVTRPQEPQQWQESVKKHPVREEKDELPDETVIIEETEYAIREDAAEEAPAADAPVPCPDRERNRAKFRKGVLGQPVRRENPNRTDIPAAGAAPEPEKGKAGPGAAPAAETAPADTGLKGAWADALEKAIQAISQDK